MYLVCRVSCVVSVYLGVRRALVPINESLFSVEIFSIFFMYAQVLVKLKNKIMII